MAAEPTMDVASATRLLHDYCKRFSNWGKWGPEDQLGTVNYITRDKVLAALALPKTGEVVSLALPYDANGPQNGSYGRVNPIRTMMATGTDHCAGRQQAGGAPLPYGIGYSDDAVTMPLQCGTQWDALSHIFHEGKMYNGRSANEVSATGAATNGIEHMRANLIGRGVFLDVPRAKGVDWLPDGTAITIDDLEATAAKQKVEVREGDVVVVRTGQIGRCKKEGWGTFAGGDAPGLSLHTAPWLHDKKIAAVATDTWGMEVRPNELPGALQPLHIVVIVYMGLTVGEIFALEELSAACARAGRYEFLFVGPPLPFTGAVGSPLNPVAIL